jgi:hypothetical protein
MAAEILGELLITLVAQVAAHAALTGPVREWKLDRFYKGLDEPKKRAFLELIALAVHADGVVDARETQWLARRKEVGPEVGAEIDGAFEHVKTTLRDGLSSPSAATFLAERVAKFTDDDDRERIYVALAVLLSPAANITALAQFRDALAISTTKATWIDSKVASGMS